MILRGLVLHQPWAHACIHLEKDVENRSRTFHHRGPLVIVAGKNNDPGYRAFAFDFINRLGLNCPCDLEQGGIIGCVELYGVRLPDEYPVTRWHMPDKYALLIRNAVPLPFRPLKGHQGLMRIEVTDEEIDLIVAGGISLD